MRVLVVDDQADLRELVTQALVQEGHRVETAATAAEAERALIERTFDVVLLDLGLPDDSGTRVCRRAREMGITTPILVLTAQSAVETRVASLDLGADDFLGKPFALAELKARIRALARRAGSLATSRWSRGEVTLDFASRRATGPTGEVPLTAREWAILELLAMAGGRLVSRDALMDELWAGAPSYSSLEVLVTRIRKKLGTDVLETVRGQGYRLG